MQISKRGRKKNKLGANLVSVVCERVSVSVSVFVAELIESERRRPNL